MEVLFLNSFKKDLKKLKNKSIKLKVKNVILNLENSRDLKGLPNVKKLSGNSYTYRIRIGNYRMGFYLKNNTIIFVRFLKRSAIYKVFP